MTLTLCTDLSPADWIAGSELPWNDLVTFGPAGFGAYARLRFLPDPVRSGQNENDAEGQEWRDEQLPRLFEVLATATTTPGDCYFAVWDGFARAVPRVTVAEAPKLEVPARDYWLFRGPLAEAGNWGAAAGWPGHYDLDDEEPAFVWPADRAWCVARDVDPHWAGIGGDAALIERLVADPRLDVVATEHGDAPLPYR
ncbi:hypothetical protein AB0F81_20925 [Actinoplanes sp. NPDC024001]|uniref:hypothetical protein n=1 Tax=Actinoplanes sp. NPDC024001 TaxID=3154598 RepID=UPI0033D066A9